MTVDRFGITAKLHEADRISGNVTSLKNKYIILYENRTYRINPSNVPSIGWGFDYYIEVLRIIEENCDKVGLTFFLSNECPTSLPQYGSSVILFVLCDEWHKYYSYFNSIRCTFKCYSLKPAYALPSVSLRGQIISILQVLIKSWGSLRSRISSRMVARSFFMRFPRVYPMPLGYFAKPTLRDAEATKDIGFLFAGSVEYPTLDTFRIRDILTPPKLASRRLMAAAAQEYLKIHPGSGLLRLTDGFLGSVSNLNDYWPLLSRAKIALCPRGGVAETYRFFEAAAAGCVIISEALPRTWYYQNNPAIIIRNWNQLGRILEELLKDESKLVEIAGRSTQYWKTTLRESVVTEFVLRQSGLSN